MKKIIILLAFLLWINNVQASTLTISGGGSGDITAVGTCLTGACTPTLSTDTDGNYVATIADGTGIDGTASGEGTTYTPTLDLTEITCGAGVVCSAATTIAFDATELGDLTFGAGTVATIAWTLSLSGATDPVATWGNDLLTLSNGLTLTTGNNFIIGTTQWNSGDSIDGTKVANADLGDITVTSGDWAVENSSHSHNAATITEADPLALLTAGTDNVKDTHIDWGTGANQVSGVDFVNEDLGTITITSGSWQVENNSHNHTGVTITGVDISDDTNLSGDTEIVLTGDALSIASTITRDIEWDTEGEVQTAWGSVNILLETEIDASSELAALMDDETGTGLLVFATSPTIATPILTIESNTAPSNTTEARLQWDTDDDELIIGNGSSTIVINRTLIGGNLAASQTASFDLGLFGPGDGNDNALIIAGKVFGFSFSVATTPGASGSWAATLQKNGSNTTITCSISNPNTKCTDTANSATFAVGDTIGVAVVETGTAAGTNGQGWNAVFFPD